MVVTVYSWNCIRKRNRVQMLNLVYVLISNLFKHVKTFRLISKGLNFELE